MKKKLDKAKIIKAIILNMKHIEPEEALKIYYYSQNVKEESLKKYEPGDVFVTETVEIKSEDDLFWELQIYLECG